MKNLTLLAVSLFAVAAVHSVQADQPSGQQVFAKWCAPCHSRGPGNPGTTALAAVYKNSKPAALEDRKDMSVPFIKQAVRNGVFVMPFFRKTEITDADLDALADYLSQPGKNR